MGFAGEARPDTPALARPGTARARQVTLLSTLATVGVACVAPTPLPLPPGGDSSAAVLYEAGPLTFLVRPDDPPYFVAEGPITAATFAGAEALRGLASGLVPAPSARPCPIPEPTARFGLSALGEEWQPVTGAPRLVGWFEGPAAPREPLAVDTTCGDGNGDWRVEAEGCALRFRTDNPGFEASRGGFGATAEGTPTVELLDLPPTVDTCAPFPAVPPALATARCERRAGACFLDVFRPVPTATTSEVVLGPGLARPWPDSVAPPFRFAYTGPALSGGVLWVAVGQASGFGCAEAARLRRLDPDTLQPVASATVGDLSIGALRCAADLVPDRAGGVWVIGRLDDEAGSTCPGTNPPRPRPWALVHVDAEGRAGPALRSGASCLTHAWRGEPDAEGWVAIGFARRSALVNGPAASAALILDVDDGRVSPPVELTFVAGSAEPAELAGLASIVSGRWLALLRGPDQFLNLVAVEQGAGLELRAAPTAPTPTILPDKIAPRGFTYLPAGGQVIAWTSSGPEADSVYWTAEDLRAAPTLNISRTSRRPRDILTGLPWPRARPTFALLEIGQVEPRETELVLTELRADEARIRALPRRTTLGQGPNHPTVARDARGHLFVTMIWEGKLIRVDPTMD